MRRIVDYRLLSGYNLELEREVRENILKGWEPLGAPFYDEEHGLEKQAIIKAKEE